MTQAAAETVWISVARAARIVGKSAMQVRRYADEGRIRSRRIGTRGWLQVSFEDVRRLRAPVTHGVSYGCGRC